MVAGQRPTNALVSRTMPSRSREGMKPIFKFVLESSSKLVNCSCSCTQGCCSDYPAGMIDTFDSFSGLETSAVSSLVESLI